MNDIVQSTLQRGSLDYPQDLVGHAISRMVSFLEQQGVFASPRIRQAFSEIPRHLFVNQFYAQEGQRLQWYLRQPPPLSDADDWLSAIYTDEALVTQVDEAGRPSSSSSQPSVMALMLEALYVHPGQRVLEIGAGTGYNAALLAHIVGDPCLVTSIEIDPLLAQQAKHALDGVVGPGVTVHVGNGLNGYRQHAPYDRLIATGSYHVIPLSWVDQLAAEGVLVMNLRGELSGGLLRLEKTKDGQSAQGAFLDIQRVQFMALHDPSDMQPSRLPNLKAYNSEPVVERVCLSESVFAPSLLRNNNFAFFLQWEFPRARTRWPQNIKTGIVTPYFIDQASRTIVKFCPTEQAGEWQVEARGKQLLWTELLHAYRRWLDLGCPKLTDYRVEIDMTGGQFVKVATTRSGNLPLPTWVIQS